MSKSKRSVTVHKLLSMDVHQCTRFSRHTGALYVELEKVYKKVGKRKINARKASNSQVILDKHTKLCVTVTENIHSVILLRFVTIFVYHASLSLRRPLLEL